MDVKKISVLLVLSLGLGTVLLPLVLFPLLVLLTVCYSCVFVAETPFLATADQVEFKEGFVRFRGEFCVEFKKGKVQLGWFLACFSIFRVACSRLAT